MGRAIRALAIFSAKAFDAFNGGEILPGPSVETDQEILDWVAKDAETALHDPAPAVWGKMRCRA